MKRPHAINVENVTLVLLADGDWYDVRGHSFTIGTHEFMAGSRPSQERLVHEGGIGFQFRIRNNDVVSGPITAILAVQEESL